MGTIRVRFDANRVEFPDPPLDVAAVDVAFQGRGPRLASAGSSVFLTWAGPVSGVGRVFLQQFVDGAAVLPLPLVLEPSSSGAANNPAVAMVGPGALFMVWEQDGRIMGQRLALDGQRLLDGRALERPRVLSTPTVAGAVQAMPALATTSDGGTAVVWRNTQGSTVDVVMRQLRHCGNGNIDPGEQCDDGNAVSGDCCSPSCEFETPGQLCDDGLGCTGSSVCSEGACVPGPPRSCDDGNACTADRCDSRTGNCVNDPALLNGVVCDDGNACTQQDACSAGACQGAPAVCDDGNECTADVCDPASGCGAVNLDGAACVDGDNCTDDDVCSAGACAGRRVCGLGPPPGGGGDGGTGGGGTGGSSTTLTVVGKGIVKVICQSDDRGRCSGRLYREGTVVGTANAALSNGRSRKFGKKTDVTLKFKLKSPARALLTNPGDTLQAELALILKAPSGSTRQASYPVTLLRPGG